MPDVRGKEGIALRLIEGNQPIRPREFAMLMWPDAPGWLRSIRANNRSCPGGGMNLAAGGYLGRLRQRGLVEWTKDGYRLSVLGEQTLQTSATGMPKEVKRES